MTDICGVFWVRLTIYAQKGACEPYLMKKKNTWKYSHIPRGYTQVLTKMSFYPSIAMEFQEFVYRRKEVTLICICDIISFQKKKHIESYI